MSERSGFDAWVREQLSAVEDCLSRWVSADAPAGLGEAMRYGVLDGGKRLRPLLALAAATEIGVAAAAPGAHFLRFGAALAAAACAGFLVGSAIAVGVRIWRLLG